MMKILITILVMVVSQNVNSQKMNEYKIDVKINASKEKVWEVITSFNNYPEWNSVLEMRENDNLTLGQKFKVTITQPDGKKSKFKAKAIGFEKLNSFSATQIILGKWFFSATHYFIIKEIDNEQTLFIQKWKFSGMLAPLFRKQIFKELEVFKVMNKELKELLEK